MSDYISREAAVDMFQRFAYDDWNQGVGISLADAFYKSAEMIGTIPAADVVEVKHGEWKETPYTDYDDTWECSVCGEPWTLIEGTPEDNLMNYCPKCGAKMDGGDVAE